MIVPFIVEKTATGFSAYAAEHDVYTTAATISQLKSNACEAFNSLWTSKDEVPLTEQDIVLEMDLIEFFDSYNIVNVKALAERTGMNQSLMSQYITRSRPISVTQRERIIKNLKQALEELAHLNFR